MRDSRAIRPVRAGRVQATKEHNDAVQDQIDHRRSPRRRGDWRRHRHGRRRLEQVGVTQIRSYIRQFADMVVEAVGRFACVDTNHPTLPRIARAFRRPALCVASRGQGPFLEEVSNRDTDRYAAMIAWTPGVHLV
jgi:hypothetical protein